MKMIRILPAALALFLPATGAFAAKFANQFVEFELPPQWQCTLEGAEWICQSADPAKKKDAIIVLAAKLRGDQDSLDQYLAYLKASKVYTSADGKPVKSEVKYAKTAEVNAQAWVDALHLESELPGFYTRYLATVKQDIGVLVTYSINKNKYQQYLKDFDALVNTLRVFRRAGGINAGPQGGNLFQQAQIPAGSVSDNSVFAVTGAGEGSAPAAKKNDDLVLYLVIGAGIVGFIILRRRKRS